MRLMKYMMSIKPRGGVRAVKAILDDSTASSSQLVADVVKSVSMVYWS